VHRRGRCQDDRDAVHPAEETLVGGSMGVGRRGENGERQGAEEDQNRRRVPSFILTAPLDSRSLLRESQRPLEIHSRGAVPAPRDSVPRSRVDG
jgi:hypothetical protein